MNQIYLLPDVWSPRAPSLESARTAFPAICMHVVLLATSLTDLEGSMCLFVQPYHGSTIPCLFNHTMVQPYHVCSTIYINLEDHLKLPLFNLFHRATLVESVDRFWTTISSSTIKASIGM